MGFAGKAPKEAREVFEMFATRLLLETEHRGPHATGVSGYIGANRRVIGKGPVPATMFVRTPVWKRSLEAHAVIAHCRYATHGSPQKNENNHPFESGKWSMVHNGVIHGHKYIAEKEGVKLVSECDSEVILRVFARGAKKDGPTAGFQRFVDSVKSFSADYAVAILDGTNGKIRLLRDEGRPCSIVKLPALGIVAFASTTAILKAALEATRKAFPDYPLLDGAHGFECNPDKVYVLDPHSLEVDHEEIKVDRQKFIGFKDSRYSDSATSGGGKPAAVHSLNAISGVGENGELVYTCDLCGEDEDSCKCEELTKPE